MTSTLKKIGMPVAALIVCFTVVVALSGYLERNRVSLPESYADEDLDLQGRKLTGFALGSEGLLADWYWMRSLQYIGDKIVKSDSSFLDIGNLKPLNPRLLYPLLDNATDLDPKFITPISYGATVLPAIDPEQAIRLTEKGIRNNPDNWRLYQYLGYIYWRLGNFEKASQVYDEGSKIPGAPTFFTLMAAKMRSEGGARETAREIYSQAAADAPDQSTRFSAERRIMQLDSLDEQDAINAALSSFRAKNGRCPNGWNEVIPLLRSVVLPGGREFHLDESRNLVDPSGAPYLLDRTSCSVKLDLSKTKIPLG